MYYGSIIASPMFFNATGNFSLYRDSYPDSYLNKPVNCINCGGPLNFEYIRRKHKCEYCGTPC